MLHVAYKGGGPAVIALVSGETGHLEVAKNLGNQTLDPMPMTLDQFAALLKSDYQKYERLVKASGIRIG